MRKIELSELKKNENTKKYFDLMQEWTEDALLSCFKFIALELEPFEFYFSDGSACVLISGKGKLWDREISAPASFGVTIKDDKAESISEIYKATEESIVICFNKNIFNNICFGMGCGSMHTRFRELILDNLHRL